MNKHRKSNDAKAMSVLHAPIRIVLSFTYQK
jgi:hypothetical protein